MEIVASCLNPWPNASEGAKAISYQPEIIEKITLPGLELRSYDKENLKACGSCDGGTITFGFVPQETEPAGK